MVFCICKSVGYMGAYLTSYLKKERKKIIHAGKKGKLHYLLNGLRKCKVYLLICITCGTVWWCEGGGKGQLTPKPNLQHCRCVSSSIHQSSHFYERKQSH